MENFDVSKISNDNLLKLENASISQSETSLVELIGQNITIDDDKFCYPYELDGYDMSRLISQMSNERIDKIDDKTLLQLGPFPQSEVIKRVSDERFVEIVNKCLLRLDHNISQRFAIERIALKAIDKINNKTLISFLCTKSPTISDISYETLAKIVKRCLLWLNSSRQGFVIGLISSRAVNAIDNETLPQLDGNAQKIAVQKMSSERLAQIDDETFAHLDKEVQNIILSETKSLEKIEYKTPLMEETSEKQTEIGPNLSYK